MVEHQATYNGTGYCAAKDAKLGIVEVVCVFGSRVAQGGHEHAYRKADAAKHADTCEGLPVGMLRHLNDAQADAYP